MKDRIKSVPGEQHRCCEDKREAMQDGVLVFDRGFGTCLVVGEKRAAINHCPWCGCRQPTGLYASPSMVYRP